MRAILHIYIRVEGAGVIEAVGEDIEVYHVGDRVAFADVPNANAEYVMVPEEKIIPIPKWISFEVASSILLQGLTADYLVNDSFKVQPNQIVAIHTITGGVGQILLQLVNNMGAKVIGLTSSNSKKDLALSPGADSVFLYSEDWVKNIIDYTSGNGVDVVYDSVGSTLLDSIEIVKQSGTIVTYGTAGGELWNVLTNKNERVTRSKKLFNMIKENQLAIKPRTIYKLSEGREAHRFMESRQSMGKIILVP